LLRNTNTEQEERLKKMDLSQNEIQAANCSLCGELPDELIVSTGREQQFPAAFYNLIPVGPRNASQGCFSQDYRCPECGVYFVWEEHRQMYGSGNNDEERLFRTSMEASAENQANCRLNDEAQIGSAKQAAEVESARARHAFSIMKKHFASAGVEMKHSDPPKDWSHFCLLFYLNTSELLEKGLKHEKLLRGMLAEMVDFVRAFSGRDYTVNLYKLLGDFRRYSWLAPLLPDSARHKISDLEELRSQYEDDDERFRQGQMSY
jgi:hypothetical protein